MMNCDITVFQQVILLNTNISIEQAAPSLSSTPMKLRTHFRHMPRLFFCFSAMTICCSAIHEQVCGVVVCRLLTSTEEDFWKRCSRFLCTRLRRFPLAFLRRTLCTRADGRCLGRSRTR